MQKYDFTETKISEIKVGQVVLVHGRLFRVTSSKEYPSTTAGRPDLRIWVHQTEDLGNAWSDNPSQIPKGWLADWTIQSNDIPRWAVVNDADAMCHCGMLMREHNQINSNHSPVEMVNEAEE